MFYVVRLALLLAVLWQPAFMAVPAVGMHVCGMASGPAAPHHDGMDCAHCPLCAFVAQAALISAPPALPAIGAGWRLRSRLAASARAPPVVLLLAAYPRGPPSLA